MLDGALSTDYIAGTPTLEAAFGSVNIPTIGAPANEIYAHFLTEGGSTAYWLYPTPLSVTLDATSQNGGVFTVQAELDPLSVPEPTTLAVLAMAGLAFLAKRRITRR